MRKKVNKKLIVALLSFVLLFGGTFGSSLAWLLDTSDEVANTFTTSDINIELTESTNLDLKMIPGHKVGKDPHVTVHAGSEACWVFVEITEDLGAWEDNKEGAKFSDYLSYTIADGWTKGDGKDIPENVYYRTVLDATAAKKFQVLKGETPDWEHGFVQVDGSVTKEMMEEIDGYTDPVSKVPDEDELENRPTLSFKAYAVQYYESSGKPFEVAKAWTLAKDLD